MAPTKSTAQNQLLGMQAATANHTIATRSRTTTNHQLRDAIRGKRKADFSPPSKDNAVKRSAFSDLSNVQSGGKPTSSKTTVTLKTVTKKVMVQTKILASVKTVIKPKRDENLAPPSAPGKVQTRGAAKNVGANVNQTAVKPKEVAKETKGVAAGKKRLSNEFEKTEESLYCSALEDSNDSTYYSAKKPPPTAAAARSAGKFAKDSSPHDGPGNVSIVARDLETKLNLGNHEVPQNVNDYDKENWDDIFQVSHYAMDIFNYYKTRESTFEIKDYMDRQICLTRNMRALLVDWMVEIQESFELNHETLYLGVKLVDMYLGKMTVSKETLQLVGAAAMFIASKYDERMPPMIDDFLYICDGAYSRRELIRMEINLLKVCDFDLGIPISYRFLRRYARCAKVTMPVLTLARYILEYSLMDYETVTRKDSILASASLYLALRMKNMSHWTPTLEFYTGYKLTDISSAVQLLNDGLHRPTPRKQLMTVRNKYSHKIFFEVAKIPLMKNQDL